MENAEIGIIGGTGIYDPGLLEDSKELSIETPYGAPSEKITVGQYNGKKVAKRHGKKHTILPHSYKLSALTAVLKKFDSALVEKRGPSMHTYDLPVCIFNPVFLAASSMTSSICGQNGSAVDM